MNSNAFAQPQQQPPPGQGAIGVGEIISIYVAIASIATTPTEGRTNIIAQLEKVILGFASSLNFGVPN